MGPRFLNIFAKQFSLELDAAARVEPEYYAGPKCEDRGGRIDILITDKNSNEVVIENKIYAADQENQINRYLKSRPCAKVFFLTLNGRDPAEKVGQEDGKRFKCISYATDIIPWLEACRREAAHAPLVRETIAQYINLIKVLTGQNTNSRMKDQITKSILETPETLEAYFTLLRNQQDVINKLLEKLEKECREIGEELRLKVDFRPNELGNTGGGFYFFNEEMKSQNLRIGFEFNQNNFRSLDFGIARWDAAKDATRTPIADHFENVFGVGCSFNSWWPAWKSWPGREDWWNGGTFRDIFSGDFKKELREKVEKLARILCQPSV